MANVLLINPSYMGSYGGNKMSVVAPTYPTLSLSTIAAGARERGHKVKILDLSMYQYNYIYVDREVHQFKPDICGITALTPCINQLIDISIMIKDISKHILVVGGGTHATSLPEETMHQSKLDAIVEGEGDLSFTDICDGSQLKDIKGLYYREGKDIKFTGIRPLIENLDELPFPAWDLYDTELYKKHISRLLCKKRPVAVIEFSRGCVFKCDYCASKMTVGLGHRRKSPQRCADEVKFLHSLGFKEFAVADDIFTCNRRWAIEVSEAIIDTGLRVPWTCLNGIRVESANQELFEIMKKAGCYRVSFGFESGNNEVLKKFGKGGLASIEQGAEAVRLANKAGLDTNGYFMLGLSCDTEETMAETINFARELSLNMLKFSITIAFPGTPMFNTYREKGLIKSYNWDDYHIYTAVSLFQHESLSFDIVSKYMKLAYRRAITMNPKFIFRRIKGGIVTGEFFWDLIYFFKFIFTPTTNKSKFHYYAKDRWPKFIFSQKKNKHSEYQTIKTKLTRPPENRSRC
jgi:radical SAM superfamily enzyme YgiQ (UPF0313 family)